MRTKLKASQEVAPNPRLLPEDAYPPHVDEAGRDRVDKKLREQMHTIPTEPGDYLDNEDEPWTLAADGSWIDQHGTSRSSEYTPIVWLFGPFTQVEKPEATPRVHVATEEALPVGTAVYKARVGGRKGNVVGHLSDGTIGIRWDGGGTSSGPVHFGFWVDAEPEPEREKGTNG
jgi:hypothetical protein